MISPRYATLVILLAAGAATAETIAPVRMALRAGSEGRNFIRFKMTSFDDPKPFGARMLLPYRVSQGGRVELGPARFSETDTPPPWPSGAQVSLKLSPLDGDSDWQLLFDSALPADVVARWRAALRQRYALGVGIVRLAEQPLAVGDEWHFDEVEPRGDHRLHVTYSYRLLSREGKVVKIAVKESTRVEPEAPGGKVGELIEGELSYDIGSPLPIGGWLQISATRADGKSASVRYEYGR